MPNIEFQKQFSLRRCLVQWLRTLCIAGFSILSNFISFGQSIPPPPVARAVDVDLANLQVKTKLPFDAPFVLVVTPAKDIESIRLVSIVEQGGRDIVPASLKAVATQPQPSSTVFVGEKLGLMFTPIAGASRPADGSYALPNRSYVITMTAVLKDHSSRTFVVEAFSDASLSDNVKLDFGVGYAPSPKAVIGLTSVHFYATPINEDADLASKNISLARRFLTRTSFFVGLSPITLSENDAQPIKAKYKLGSLIYGIGYRAPFYGAWLNNNRFGRTFLQPMRLNAGILNFTQTNANPAIGGDAKKHTFFMALTFDLNISTVLGPIAKIFQ